MPVDACMCWNHMTVPQRKLLSRFGLIQGYGGGPCGSRAEVAVMIGADPGPRFYCRPCAAAVAAFVERELP